MLHPDGVQVIVRRAGAKNAYEEWAHPAIQATNQRVSKHRSIAVRHDDYYEVVLRFDADYIFGMGSNNDQKIRFPSDEIDVLKVDVEIDNTTASQELFLSHEQVRGEKEHVIANFRCNLDGHRGFVVAPVKFYSEQASQTERHGKIPAPKAKGQAGVIAVAIRPGKVTKVVRPRFWPAMLKFSDAVLQNGSAEVRTRPLYECGVSDPGMIFEKFEAQAVDNAPQYEFKFECALRATLSKTHRLCDVESLPSFARLSSPQPLVMLSTSILTKAHRDFFLDLLHAINNSGHFQNALKSYQQSGLKCPFSFKDIFDALLDGGQFSVRTLTGSVLVGLYFFEENNFVMTATDIKSIMIRESSKWSVDDELGTGISYMLEFPPKSVAIKMAGADEKPPWMIPISYSTTADAVAKGITRPGNNSQREASPDPLPQRPHKRAKRSKSQSKQGNQLGSDSISPAIAAPSKSPALRKIHAVPRSAASVVRNSRAHFTRPKAPPAVPSSSPLPTKPSATSSTSPRVLQMTPSDGAMFQIPPQIPIGDQLSSGPKMKPLPKVVTPPNELQTMGERELELEVKIKTNEVFLLQRRGGKAVEIVQLQIAKMDFEIEIERRRMQNVDLGEDSDAMIVLQIKLSEHKQQLRKLQKKVDLAGGTLSDSEVEKEIELDKMRLKLERRKRANVSDQSK